MFGWQRDAQSYANKSRSRAMESNESGLAAIGPARIHEVARCLQCFHRGAAESPRIGFHRGRGMRSPLDGQTIEDEAGTRQMLRSGDDLGGVPAMRLHHMQNIAGVLHRVARLRFKKDRR